MLTLPIKKKWFDMIESGEKTEEYRAASLYYIIRFGYEYCLGLQFQKCPLGNEAGGMDFIRFRQ